MGAGKAADAATSARLKPLIMTEAQSLAWRSSRSRCWSGRL
jgi:hypothetical protein